MVGWLGLPRLMDYSDEYCCSLAASLRLSLLMLSLDA